MTTETLYLTKKTSIAGLIGVSFGVGILGSLLIAWFFSIGSFWASWLSNAIILTLCIFTMAAAWKFVAGGTHPVAWMMAVAFLLRLGFGLFLSAALPVYGFNEPVQRAGYVFYDAYRRDVQALSLAHSADPLWMAFGQDFFADQYGGLLSLSAWIYRYLSPDAHRPTLILILAAFFVSLGIPFLWRGISTRCDQRMASITCWIFALYPESILLGASQMREPFLLGFLSIAFWIVLSWQQLPRKKALAVLIVSLAGMALFSSRIAAGAFAVLMVWFWVEQLLPQFTIKQRRIGWGVLLISGILLLGLSWGWFQSSATYDARLTEAGSGWVDKMVDEFGQQWRTPFILGYGIAQPVLPAAIADATQPIWWGIAIFRALGWYILAPFLVYGIWSSWKAKPAADRRIILLLAAVVAVWILISSARGGGDQWDNPRYRTIFLPWMALLAAWAVTWARQTKDAWLWRWLIVETIFVGFFTNWYLSRYFLLFRRLFFRQMVAWIVGLSAVVILGGLLWDFVAARRKKRRIQGP